MSIEKFSDKAEEYHDFRPTYPSALYDYLFEKIVRVPCNIADIGAGTGKFAKPMLHREECTVYCIEPNAEMIGKMEEYLKGYSYERILASAENTTLPDKSIDYITVAQAFHWFDKMLFRLECKRILRNHGVVILIWNMRDEGSLLVQENYLINKEFCPDFKGFSGGFHNEDQLNDFFSSPCNHLKFDNPTLFTSLEAFIGRNLSGSYAPTKDMDTYEPYVNSLTELFMKHSKDGSLIMPNNTAMFFGEVG